MNITNNKSKEMESEMLPLINNTNNEQKSELKEDIKLNDNDELIFEETKDDISHQNMDNDEKKSEHADDISRKHINAELHKSYYKPSLNTGIFGNYTYYNPIREAFFGWWVTRGHMNITQESAHVLKFGSEKLHAIASRIKFVKGKHTFKFQHLPSKDSRLSIGFASKYRIENCIQGSYYDGMLSTWSICVTTGELYDDGKKSHYPLSNDKYGHFNITAVVDCGEGEIGISLYDGRAHQDICTFKSNKIKSGIIVVMLLRGDIKIQVPDITRMSSDDNYNKLFEDIKSCNYSDDGSGTEIIQLSNYEPIKLGINSECTICELPIDNFVVIHDESNMNCKQCYLLLQHYKSNKIWETFESGEYKFDDSGSSEYLTYVYNDNDKENGRPAYVSNTKLASSKDIWFQIIIDDIALDEDLENAIGNVELQITIKYYWRLNASEYLSMINNTYNPEIKIRFIDVPKYDITYEADVEFMNSLYYDGPTSNFGMKLDYYNQYNILKDKPKYGKIATKEITYLVSFGEDFELERFPFDSQDIPIEIKPVNFSHLIPAYQDNKQLRKTENIITISPPAKRLGVLKYENVFLQCTDNLILVNIKFSRLYAPYLYQLFLIMFICSLLNISFFSLDNDETSDKLGIVLILILALLFIDKPKIPLITFVDRYYYCSFGFMGILVVFISLNASIGNENDNNNLISFIIFMIIFIIYNIIFIGLAIYARKEEIKKLSMDPEQIKRYVGQTRTETNVKCVNHNGSSIWSDSYNEFNENDRKDDTSRETYDLLEHVDQRFID